MTSILEMMSKSDFRGEVHTYDANEVTFNISFTKAGWLRAGEVHPFDQYNLILQGEVEITTRQDDQDVVTKKLPNEVVMIPAGVPHLFRFLADTIMIEWRKGPFSAEYYEPYRKLIQEQLSNKTHP